MSREQRHAAQEQYAEFYDEAAQETAAWLNGAEWARDPEDREGACVCGVEERCLFCRAPMCCGPEKSKCDAGDHCELCLHECSLCRSMMRDDRRW